MASTKAKGNGRNSKRKPQEGWEVYARAGFAVRSSEDLRELLEAALSAAFRLPRGAEPPPEEEVLRALLIADPNEQKALLKASRKILRAHAEAGPTPRNDPDVVYRGDGGKRALGAWIQEVASMVKSGVFDPRTPGEPSTAEIVSILVRRGPFARLERQDLKDKIEVALSEKDIALGIARALCGDPRKAWALVYG